MGSVSQVVGAVLSLKKNVQSLQEKMNALDISKRELLQRIEDDETQEQQAIQLVQWWVAEVDTLQRDWDQINYDGKNLHGLNAWSRYWISKRALDKLELADGLLRTVQTFMMMAMTGKRTSRGILDMPKLPMVGVDHTFQQLKDCIQGGEGGVFGLYGMGGVGKTMMLQMLKDKVGQDFDAVVMLEISEDRKDEEIQREIGSQLGLGFSENENKKALRARIYEHLNVRRFLVILDDVWNDVDLYSIGIPEPNTISKSKIVLATRIAKVCTSMRVRKTIEMTCLSRQDAWELFLSIIGPEFISSDPMIMKHAMDITHKCGGLPLALQTLAIAMMSRRTREEWMQAVASMENDPSAILGMENKIFHSLKRSYDNLGDDELQRCFLHLSLFPEGHAVDKQVLAEMFIKHGMLDMERQGRDEAYYKGLDLISKLRSSCMLEIETGFYGQDRVRMQSMMRSLALWIASDHGKNKGSLLVHGGCGNGDQVENSILNEDSWRDAKVISIMESNTSALPMRPACRNLDALLLVANKSMYKVPDELFMHMPLLRVLNLSRTPIEEIPSEISKCANLLYLDLCHTKLKGLPEGLGYLRKLKYLDISHSARLQTIPLDVISKLSMLQVLNASPYGYGNWGLSGGTPVEMGGVPLEELESLDHLKSLGITIKSKDMLQRLCASTKLAGVVDDLHLNKLEDITRLVLPMPTLGPYMKKIKRLKIHSCDELRELEIGGGNVDPMLKVENLELWCLEKMSKIVYNQPKASQFLHRLREFRIYRCGIEHVVDPNIELVLPNLQCLHLGDLQELKSVCRNMSSLPRLKFLGVYRCPKLKKLPHGMGSCKSLMHICGQREWWDLLEWEDEGERSLLETLLNRYQQ